MCVYDWHQIKRALFKMAASYGNNSLATQVDDSSREEKTELKLKCDYSIEGLEDRCSADLRSG